MRRPALALCLLGLVALSSPALLSGQVADHPVVADSTTSLSHGANVRILATGLGPDWVPGTVGLANENCTIVLVESSMSPDGKLGVFVGAAKAVQVEFRDTDATVKWKPVAIKALVASQAQTCARS
jgi:hypothetical protein